MHSIRLGDDTLPTSISGLHTVLLPSLELVCSSGVAGEEELCMKQAATLRSEVEVHAHTIFSIPWWCFESLVPAARTLAVANIDLRANAGRRNQQDQSQERDRTVRCACYASSFALLHDDYDDATTTYVRIFFANQT